MEPVGNVIIDHGMKFCWPPDISFPINVEVEVSDSSSPPKRGVVRTEIKSGEKCRPSKDIGIEKTGISM